jgi:hypothetical protein
MIRSQPREMILANFWAPVDVGYSIDKGKGIKAYDGATFRKPNLELVKKSIDRDTYMLESKCGELKLVVTKYFDTDWTDILVQLQCLYKE